MSLALALLLQVGPNPVPLPPGSEEDILNRQPRADAQVEVEDPTARWLVGCLDQLEEDAARAHTQAQIKRNQSTGPDRVVANHCLGLAATELGLWDDARTAFLAAREETPADEMRTRARFALMAGNAALGQGDAESARAFLTTAQEEAKQAASATLQAIAATDLSRALVALDRNEEALTALETATSLEPDKGEGWLLKATLLRRMERLDGAQAAIERAVELAPTDAQIGLEAGVIAVLSGRIEAARQSWQSVIDTQPDSLAAKTAKDYLAQLGPKPSEEAPL